MVAVKTKHNMHNKEKQIAEESKSKQKQIPNNRLPSAAGCTHSGDEAGLV
jgi:hypothetical protein